MTAQPGNPYVSGMSANPMSAITWMPPQKPTDSENAALLAEIEDVMRTTPPQEILKQDVQETFSWFGRAIAAAKLWDTAAGERARSCVEQMQNVQLFKFQPGFNI